MNVFRRKAPVVRTDRHQVSSLLVLAPSGREHLR
jgi:hypothetical protein